MSSKVEKKKEPVGKTPPVQFRLGPDTLADLDLIAASNGLSSRADAVRLAARREADKVRKKEKL